MISRQPLDWEGTSAARILFAGLPWYAAAHLVLGLVIGGALLGGSRMFPNLYRRLVAPFGVLWGLSLVLAADLLLLFGNMFAERLFRTSLAEQLEAAAALVGSIVLVTFVPLAVIGVIRRARAGIGTGLQLLVLSVMAFVAITWLHANGMVVTEHRKSLELIARMLNRETLLWSLQALVFGILSLLLVALGSRLRRAPQGSATAFSPGGMAVQFLAVVLVFASASVIFVRPRPVTPSRVAKAPENAPNVIEIVIDTLGGKYLRPSDLPRYPGFARLAQDGFHFERAYSTASHTGYSVPAILTSSFEFLNADRQEGDFGQLSITGEDRSTVGRLKAAGWETVGFSGNVVISKNFGYDRSFDYFTGGEGTTLLGFGLLKAIGTAMPRFAYRFGLANGGTFHENMETLYAKIASYVSRPRPDGVPFYMYVQTMDMHGPYMPPVQYLEDDFNFEDFFSPYLEKGGEQGVGEVPDALRRNALQQYLGGLRYTDRYLGLLVQKLKELGIYDDTLIVIAADHGEEFWEHGRVGHNRDDRSLREEMVRIPLFIKPPRSLHVPQRGVTVPVAVSSLDIHPTILDIAGVDPGAVRGRSLRPLMLGTNDHFEDRVLQGVGTCRDGRMFYAIRDHWKLIWLERNGRTELYDLREDPQENTNVFSLEHPVAQNLLPDLKQLSAAHARPSEKQNAPDLPLQLKSQLRALGYIQ